MRTDDLIRTLAADGRAPRPSLDRVLLVAAFAGLIIATTGFAVVLHPRADITSAALTPSFLMKLAVTLTLAASAAGLYWRALRPGTKVGGWGLALAVAPALLSVGVAYDLATHTANELMPAVVGHNHLLCLISIPLLSAPILLALLFASRHGAPENPAAAGMIAGVIAGALGAALYATHCTDDSPLFVLVWYGLSIGMTSIAGAILGSRMLRW